MFPNENLKENPYQNAFAGRKVRTIALEVPSGLATFIRSQFQFSYPGLEETADNLSKAVDILKNTQADGQFTHPPQLEGFLKRGFESSIAVFSVGSNRWVAKIGHLKPIAAGLFAPASEEYARAIRWNYAVLEDVYAPQLPHLLPQPFYVLSPEQLGYPATMQLTPFVERVPNITDLTFEQLKILWEERLLFASLSEKLLTQYKVMPDLVMRYNLIETITGDEPHLKMLDIGLFNLLSPTPILNALAYSAMRFSAIKDRLFYKSLK